MARWDAEWFRRLHQVIAGLAGKDPAEAGTVRRRLARDPIAFAVLYLGHHLRSKETGHKLTFSEAHFEWARIALEWADSKVDNGPQEGRDAVIACRGLGKSTWWFLILPLWAAANGHVKFAAAFADSSGQAMSHLQTLRTETQDNALLRNDYPDLCTPARWRSGTSVADRQSMLHMKSGFTFAARGIDSSVLGLKVGERRPDLLICDDIEPDEASYSPALAEKRRSTLLDAILALNVYARVVLVGTVTMPGSIMHQIVKAARGSTDPADDWVTDEKIRCHHHLPIPVDDAGNERSVWPAKWSLAWLRSRRDAKSSAARREYAKNYENNPLASDSVYWAGDDFTYGSLDAVARTGLWVDPAVTTKGTSDYTGLAVVGHSPSEGKVEIKHAVGVKLAGKELRLKIISLIEQYPEVSRVFVEVNQGGDLWPEVFHDIPGVKVITHTVSDSKEVRFARALPSWQRGRVLHTRRLATLEEQAVAFPTGQYDDVIDAAVSGVLHFLHPKKRQKYGDETESYL